MSYQRRPPFQDDFFKRTYTEAVGEKSIVLSHL